MAVAGGEKSGIRSSRSARAPSRLARLLLVLFGLLIAVPLLEAYFRLAPTPLTYVYMRSVVQQQCTRPHPTLEYVNREGYVGRFDNAEFHTTVRINQHGLRDRDYPYEKPAGAERILVLGDSFAFGWGVEAEQTAAKLLESNLQGVEVINGACSGWSTRQELGFLRDEGLRYHPDVALLFYCPNDPAENGLHYRFAGGRLLPADAPDTFGERVKGWLFKHSTIWIYWQRALEKAAAPAPASPPGAPDPAWAAEEGYLREMRDACSQAGARLVVTYVPGKFPGGRPHHEDDFPKLYAFCSNNHIPLLDLTPPLIDASAAQRVYYRLDDHWTPAGHAAVAEALRQFLMSRSLVP